MKVFDIFRIKKSFSSKLSLGILFLTAPIFFASLGILFWQSRHIVRNEAMKRAKSTLNATMQRVCRHLYTVETATNTNDWIVTTYMNPDTILALTHRIVRLNPHIDGCSISMEPNTFAEYGRYFSAYTIREGDSIKTVKEEDYEYFEKPWYKLPKINGKPCWVEFYDEADSLELTLDGMIASYCKPLYDANGQFVSVISTDISLIHLSKTISQEKPYPNSYFMMLGEEGRYFIHPDSTLLFQTTIFTDVDPTRQSDIIALGHEMTKGNQGSMFVNINGKKCLVCYQPVPGTSCSLALVCPDSDILEGYHQLTYIVVPLLVIGLIIILLFSRRTVAHAITPLNRLLEQTQTIASGNYEVYIPHSKREDAVGRLQNSFATMLESLNFHMGSVRYTAQQTKRRNEELVKATHLAEEADRQKTLFIQNVTHQIRTPLNIIMGFAQILSDTTRSATGNTSLSETLPEDEIKSIMETMDHNAKLLTRLVLMLFDSSDSGLSEELNSHKQDMVSCNEVSRESIGYINIHYPKVHINFETDVPDDFCIKTNHLYLMRSLRELLYNSAKYSDGQHVTLRVTLESSPENPSSKVRFIVEDKGKGISEDYQELIFKFFTKVDDLSEGLGLGLPLAKRHAQNLGGDLTFDAGYHDGCRFTLELPLQTEQ